MTKALLVDFGGVLTTSVLDSFAAFAVAEGSTPEALAAAVRDITSERENLFTLVERGALGLKEFEARLASELSSRVGALIAAEGLKSRMFAHAKPDPLMQDALRRARAAGCKTGLVSNSWGLATQGHGIDYPRELFDELFDTVVISGEVGIRKPEPEIYLLAAKDAGADPKECIFVDDFKVNVDGAKAVGMEAVLHRDTPATLKELERFLGVSLS